MIFGRSNPKQLLRWASLNYGEFKAAPDTRRLLNCIVLLNQMPDWISAWFMATPGSSYLMNVPKKSAPALRSHFKVTVRPWAS